MQNVVTRIVDIIADNFPNGIRDDFIDTNKVLRLYSANYPDGNISRSLIANVIHANGMEDGGRFYFISKSDIENIKQLVDKIFKTHAIAYYYRIYRVHVDFFAQLHIFSPDVLEKILQMNDAEHFYFSDYCTANLTTRLDDEVAKIFAATENSLSLDVLKEKLLYVPTQEILSALSDAKKYLSTNTGKYLAVSKIQFDTDEIAAAKQQILAAIDKNGSATPEDYDLSINFALNPEINAKDLRNVIYGKFFADDFTKNGRRLFKRGDYTKTGEQRGATEQLREFVAAHDELTYDELIAFGRKYDPAPSIVLIAAHEKMVRVDKNFFVKDALIKFDVGGVDEALSVFVNGKIISLRAVTSFTGFPPVAGYSWNLFLLESFLRKFSRRYTYHTPAPNSANVGAIYPKSMKFKDYLDVQAAVVLQENVPLEKSAVEDFLVGQGFRKMRIDKVNQRIIARAQEISNR